MTITPTRRRGLRATMTRSAAACADALRLIVRLPAWQSVTLVMLCVAGAMIWVAPGTVAA